MTVLGDNIKKYRKLRGLTQVDVAIKLGITGNASVSDWERGVYEPNISSLVKLADILGVSVYDLVEEDEDV